MYLIDFNRLIIDYHSILLYIYPWVQGKEDDTPDDLKGKGDEVGHVFYNRWLLILLCAHME